MLRVVTRETPSKPGKWLFPRVRALFWSTCCNKDHSILGSVLGPPVDGKPHV